LHPAMKFKISFNLKFDTFLLNLNSNFISSASQVLNLFRIKINKKVHASEQSQFHLQNKRFFNKAKFQLPSTICFSKKCFFTAVPVQVCSSVSGLYAFDSTELIKSTFAMLRNFENEQKQNLLARGIYTAYL
jgi:hypothetical protein